MKSILAVLVNYGSEQISYLEQVTKALKNFENYEVTIIVNSNIPLNINNVDKVNVIKLDDYQLLPLTCRKIIWENRNNFDLFIYGENDHLFLEQHIDKHIEYSQILPKNRISGLIQFEEDASGKYYPGYHDDFNWDFESVEVYGTKKFAHFSNVHQATFILTKDQLLRIGKKINFLELVDEKSLIFRIKRKLRKKLGLKVDRQNKYSVKCKVNTDVYLYGGMKKMICISEFENNLIHHIPNLYIEGKAGRNKFRSDSERMTNSLNKLLSFDKKKKIF
ncbi:hypothetical protein [Flavobacterium hungaricum]|uniref:Glycosyltransferase n=1 Tax=Flavobacterium hungaricum TaxID=2082725 RepID=A0ABR9TR19_9FLAO|nr:hypothetical protein [Flavobacterium hungaricum]MBE8727778.1 hypothetical protein [Flavobacterium hungaricum]